VEKLVASMPAAPNSIIIVISRNRFHLLTHSTPVTEILMTPPIGYGFHRFFFIPPRFDLFFVYFISRADSMQHSFCRVWEFSLFISYRCMVEPVKAINHFFCFGVYTFISMDDIMNMTNAHWPNILQLGCRLGDSRYCDVPCHKALAQWGGALNKLPCPCTSVCVSLSLTLTCIRQRATL